MPDIEVKEIDEVLETEPEQRIERQRPEPRRLSEEDKSWLKEYSQRPVEKEEGFFARKKREWKEAQEEFKQSRAVAKEEYIKEKHEERLESARELGKKYKPISVGIGQAALKGSKILGKGALKGGKIIAKGGYKYLKESAKSYQKQSFKKGKKRKKVIYQQQQNQPIDLLGTGFYRGGKNNTDLFGFPLNKQKADFGFPAKQKMNFALPKFNFSLPKQKINFGFNVKPIKIEPIKPIKINSNNLFGKIKL